jgi:hypothetical protein
MTLGVGAAMAPTIMQAIAASINKMFLELIINKTSTKIQGNLPENFPGLLSFRL